MTFAEVTKELLQGFWVTFELFSLTLVIALPLGLLVALGSMSRFAPIRLITRTFVWIIRGTPLMLQLFIIFYIPGIVLKTPFKSRFLAAVIAFVINYAAYFSVIYRGGIQSIPKGQYEAGQVLGMTKTQIFFKAILFQVIKKIVPPMPNEIITLVKDTSLARSIAVVEIITVANNILSLKALMWPLFYTGVFYLIFVGVLTALFNRLEKKLGYYNG